MPILKSIRHEKFVREYIKCDGNGAEAYRRTVASHPRKKLSNPDCYRVIACVILKRPDVQRRYVELREQMAKRADITMDKILSDYQEALNMARGQAKPEAMVSAATAQAKLVGLLRDRVETGNVGEFEGMDNISDVIQKISEESGPEVAEALIKAFGLSDNLLGEKSGTGPLCP